MESHFLFNTSALHIYSGFMHFVMDAFECICIHVGGSDGTWITWLGLCAAAHLLSLCQIKEMTLNLTLGGVVMFRQHCVTSWLCGHSATFYSCTMIQWSEISQNNDLKYNMGHHFVEGNNEKRLWFITFCIEIITLQVFISFKAHLWNCLFIIKI